MEILILEGFASFTQINFVSKHTQMHKATKPKYYKHSHSYSGL